MQSFQDLEVWRRAFRLIKPVYRLTARYPATERFGLIVQTRKCVIAVPASIAEGVRRRTKGEFCNSLSVAGGETSELECLLMAGVELGYATRDEVRPIIREVQAIARMIAALDKALAKRTKPRRYARMREAARPPRSRPDKLTPPGRPP